MENLLASIIGGGPANVDVTVNGKPLSSLITELAAALKNHQEQISELREYTYNTDQQMWNRISNLEEGVNKINKDLGFEQRGPQAMEAKSTYDAITTLEKNVGTLDNKRKGTASRTALTQNNLVLMRYRFHAWLNLQKRNHRLRELMATNAIMVRRRYYDKWQQAVKLFKRRRAQQRGLTVVQRFNETRLMQRYFKTWEEFRGVSLKYRAERHVALIRAVEAMRAVSLRGFMRHKWLQWLQLVAKTRLREDQKKAALRMAAVSSRSLVRRYFTMWVNLEGEHNLRRRQIRTATALAVQSARILAGRAFSNWVEAGRRKKQRRMGAALVPRMAHDQSVKLASRYYLKLWRYSMTQRDSRSRSQLEEMTKELAKRFDNLSGQVAGTMNQTQETVTQLQKLSQQQQELEKKQQQGGTTPGGGVRRPSPTLRRSGSASNMQQQQPQGSGGGLRASAAAAGQQTQQPANNNNSAPREFPPQSGVKDPSSSAMQLGSHVSQINMRGGGSGEVSRVYNTRSGSNPNNNRSSGGAMPAQWLESPDAAWAQIRSRLEDRAKK